MGDWCKLMPQEWKKYVNHEVKVTAHDKHQYEGWVFTVDPVSASVVLVVFQETAGSSVRVVLGHSVREVQVLRVADGEMERKLRSLLTPAGSQSFSEAELRERKESLQTWLEKNLVPVTDEGDHLRVANVLTVNPPYGAEQCTGSNEIILSRVQSLVENCPGLKNQQ